MLRSGDRLKRVAPLFLLGMTALLVAAPASSRKPASDATAVITGSAKRYVLTATNTGALPIRCMRFRPKYGVEIIATDGSSLARNTIGTAGPYPGETSRTHFRTRRPYPARAGGELTLSNPSFKDTCSFPAGRSEYRTAEDRLDG